MSSTYEFEGFKDLADIVSKYVDGAENAIEGKAESKLLGGSKAHSLARLVFFQPFRLSAFWV